MPAIGTAIAGSLFAAGTVGYAVTAAVVDIGLSVGLSYVAKAVMGKQQTATTGNSGKMSFGGAVARSFMVGVGMTAGSLLYWGSWGNAGKTPNAYVTFVVALEDLPVTSLEELWVDSVKVTVPDMSGAAPVAQGYPVAEYTKSGKDNLWIKLYDGTQTTADAFLVDTFGSSTDRPWTSTAVCKGMAYAILTARDDSSLFSGFPKFNFALKGIPVYDIRKDSTNGGLGSQRFTDPSTWVWSDNAANVTYTVMRGLSYAGQWFYGLQNISANRMPYAEWAAAADKCDVVVTNADGSTEAQYRCGGEIPVGTQTAHTVNDLLTAQNGRLCEAGGIYKLRVGAAGSSVLSFSDDDILSTEDQTFDPIISLGDKINGLTAKYPEPNQMWAQYDAPPLYNADFEAEDGNRRLLTDVSYNLVPYQRQVQRLMKSALAEHRRARKHTLMLPPWGYPLEPGTVIAWTSARNGYDAKLFRVDQVADQPNCDIQVQITEVDPSDYDWDAATDEKPVSYGSLTINVPGPQLMTGWSAQGVEVDDAHGTPRRPSIELFFDGDLTDVKAVRAQVRLPGAAGVQFDGESPYGTPTTEPSQKSSIISFASILPNTKYEVRGIYVPYSSRGTLWSNESLDGSGNVVEGPWISVTTPNAQFTTDDIADDAITSNKILAGAVTELQLADQAVATAKLQVAAVTADILADQAVLGSKLADAAVSSTKIADDAVVASKLAAGAVDTTKFATGITPVEIGSSLPTTGNFEGRQFYNESDGKTYTYTSGAWTSTIAAGDIAGQITQSQIADAAITANKLADQAITLTKFATGLAPVENGSTLPTTGNFVGRVFFLTSDNQIYRWNGSWTVYVPAASITGQLTDSQLAAISAAKLTGQITGTQISDGAISTPQLAAGAVTAANIAADTILAGNIASGAITSNELAAGSVTANAIAANSISSGMIQAGAVSTAQLAAGAVTTNVLAAGAVTTPIIAAGAITASKLVLTDFTNLVPDNQMVDQGSWSPGAGWSFGGGSSIGGKNYYHYTAQGNSAYGQPLNSLQFPIDATKTYFFSINYTLQGSGTVQFLFRVSWRDIGNNELSTSDIAVGPTSVGGTLSGQATPPSAAQFAYAQAFAYDPGTTTSLAVALPVVRVMANAELIVDGSITTSKLLAGSVTSDILAANSVVAGKIAAGAVSATQLAAGSITSDKLTIGRATNWIENSDFSAGLARWTWAGTSPNVSVRLRADNLFNVAGHPCFEIYDPNPGDESGNYYDVTPVNADGSVGFPVEPNGYYEVSAYMNNHRCSVCLYCEFIDAAGNHISYGNYTTFPATNTGGDGLLSMFTPRSTFHQAPSNAATARPYFRKLGTDAGGPDSYLFMYRCQLAEATANQTEPSPWSPAGITLVTSDVIKTGAVIADAIQAGAVSAEKLSVGTSSNMIQNSDFLSGSLAGISIGADDAAGAPNYGIGLSPWYPSGMQSAYISYDAGVPNGPGGFAQINRPNIDGSLAYFPVVADQTYEFSAYLSIHRCNAYARLIFFDASNNVVADLFGNICAENVVGNTSLGSWSRSWVIEAAPSTATKCIGRVQMIGNGGTNPYVFYTGLYLSQANPNQSTPSPWSPAGATAIDGNQVITNSLYASKIVAASITSDKMAANSVTAGAIAAGSVTSAAIAAGAVTADKITVANLAALGITVGSADIQDAAISSPKRFDLEYEDLRMAA